MYNVDQINVKETHIFYLPIILYWFLFVREINFSFLLSRGYIGLKYTGVKYIQQVLLKICQNKVSKKSV
jgi:hypothetical protein